MAIKDLNNTNKCIFICNGGSCMRKDAENVTQAFRKNIKDVNLEDNYHTVRTRCMGVCNDAPVAMLAPDSIWLKNINPSQCNSILSQIQLNTISKSKHFLHQM